MPVLFATRGKSLQTASTAHLASDLGTILEISSSKLARLSFGSMLFIYNDDPIVPQRRSLCTRIQSTSFGTLSSSTAKATTSSKQQNRGRMLNFAFNAFVNRRTSLMVKTRLFRNVRRTPFHLLSSRSSSLYANDLKIALMSLRSTRSKSPDEMDGRCTGTWTTFSRYSAPSQFWTSLKARVTTSSSNERR